MENTALVITSIANQDNKVLRKYAELCGQKEIPFILIGDTKSPKDFALESCSFYALEAQKKLDFKLAEIMPEKKYARKNLGYLIAMQKGAEVILETDDDNYPLASFWQKKERYMTAHLLEDKGWVNVYKYFTDVNIWPRGFALEKLLEPLPDLPGQVKITAPIQQGLADDNPDVDAIYRLILPLPIKFDQGDNVAIGRRTVCPFNSQNMTWFKEAFPLLYLPSYCSFRMTDIWRSFVAQRVAWECDWPILFHNATVWQDRNEHNLMKDFEDEIPGYTNNLQIIAELTNLKLEKGRDNIGANMLKCYEKLIDMQLVGAKEKQVLNAWLKDLEDLLSLKLLIN